ncbi:ABC transporter ATP-binding protein [soil metagenome]
MIPPAPSGGAPPRREEVITAFDHVSFSYPGMPVAVLEEASFTIRERESLCIVGPNGGGKTTLLKLLLGLLHPTAGTIRVFGETPAKARLRIGYMPQQLQYDSRFPITVLEVVLMGRLDRCRLGLFGKANKAAAMDALAEVGMAGLAGRQFTSLSGGQRQRALIARALACDPAMLLLDEPTANVDQAVEEQFFATLRHLNERMAIVMVNHDLGVVSSMAESVLCVNRDVHVHPTSALTGRSIEEIYGMGAQAVHHREGECHDHHH